MASHMPPLGYIKCFDNIGLPAARKLDAIVVILCGLYSVFNYLCGKKSDSIVFNYWICLQLHFLLLTHYVIRRRSGMRNMCENK